MTGEPFSRRGGAPWLPPPGLELPLTGVELLREFDFECDGEVLVELGLGRRSREYVLMRVFRKPGRCGWGLRTLRSRPILILRGRARARGRVGVDVDGGGGGGLEGWAGKDEENKGDGVGMKRSAWSGLISRNGVVKATREEEG